MRRRKRVASQAGQLDPERTDLPRLAKVAIDGNERSSQQVDLLAIHFLSDGFFLGAKVDQTAELAAQGKAVGFHFHLDRSATIIHVQRVHLGRHAAPGDGLRAFVYLLVLFVMFLFDGERRRPELCVRRG